MKTTLALVTVVALATSSIACSSSGEKADVDTGSALSALRSPTGSFSPKNAAKAFSGYRGEKENASKVSTPSAPAAQGSGKSGTQSIRLLDHATSSDECGQGQDCACPNGGSMAYAGESTSEGQVVRVTFDACVFEDGFAFDGKAVLLASTKPLLGLSDANGATPAKENGGEDGYAALLLAVKGTATEGTQTLPLEIALLTEASYAFLAVNVPDGSIVVGVSDDGRAIVKSREGTWTCHSASNGWTCTSENGEALEVDERAASDDAPATTSGEGESTGEKAGS